MNLSTVERMRKLNAEDKRILRELANSRKGGDKDAKEGAQDCKGSDARRQKRRVGMANS